MKNTSFELCHELARTPNIIVRSLYSIFEWIGDFKPIMSSLIGWLGRSILLVVNFIILAGVITISWANSLELLRYIGLHNGLE